MGCHHGSGERMGPGAPAAAWQPWALLDPDSPITLLQRIVTGKTSQKRKYPTSMYTFVFSPFPASFTTSYPTHPHSDLPEPWLLQVYSLHVPSFQIGFVFFSVLIFFVLYKKLLRANESLPAKHLLSRTWRAHLNPRSSRMGRHCTRYHCLLGAQVGPAPFFSDGPSCAGCPGRS